MIKNCERINFYLLKMQNINKMSKMELTPEKIQYLSSLNDKERKFLNQISFRSSPFEKNKDLSNLSLTFQYNFLKTNQALLSQENEKEFKRIDEDKNWILLDSMKITSLTLSYFVVYGLWATPPKPKIRNYVFRGLKYGIPAGMVMFYVQRREFAKKIDKLYYQIQPKKTEKTK